MMSGSEQERNLTILIAGASRGLGLGLAAAFAARGWRVVATARGTGHYDLDALAVQHPGAVCIEMLDTTDAGAIAALRARLANERLDILFVNAGITTRDPLAGVGEASAGDFAQVMLTNALGPLRVIEALQHLVPVDGLIGAMSSGQGSIANNETGQREVYRASKAALNMLMRSFAAREANAPRAMVLLAPGWIRTDLGGPEAPYTLEESVPLLVDLLLAKRRRPGLEYLDRFGDIVPW